MHRSCVLQAPFGRLSPSGVLHLQLVKLNAALFGLSCAEECSQVRSTRLQVLCCFAGLAHDALSAENAVIILQSARTPLIIDPSGQSSIWLQAHLKAKAKDTNYEVVAMQSDRCFPWPLLHTLQIWHS